MGAGEMVAVVVVDGTDKRKHVGMASVVGQQFGKLNAGGCRVDGLVRAAVLAGGVGLGVVGFQLAGAAVKPDQNDGFVIAAGRSVRSPAEEISQRKPGQAEEAGLQDA